MKIEAVELRLNSSSLFLVDKGDSVTDCKIQVFKSGPGADHPIQIRDGAIFRRNLVTSELPTPIICETFYGTHNFLGFGDNIMSIQNEAEDEFLKTTNPIKRTTNQTYINISL